MYKTLNCSKRVFKDKQLKHGVNSNSWATVSTINLVRKLQVTSKATFKY